jgi:phage gpG-like protein
MFRFRLEIAGEVQMDRGIARFADGVSDYRPIWPVIEDDFYALEKDQFKTEGSEGGEQWKELTPEYQQWKEAHYPSKPILQRTGDLVKSLTSSKDTNAICREERKGLTLGSKIPYAIYHQSPAPRKRLPRRPEIMLTEPFKRTVTHHLQVYLVQMASACGFRTGLGPLESSQLGKYFGAGIPPRGTSPVTAGDTRHF